MLQNEAELRVVPNLLQNNAVKPLLARAEAKRSSGTSVPSCLVRSNQTKLKYVLLRRNYTECVQNTWTNSLRGWSNIESTQVLATHMIGDEIIGFIIHTQVSVMYNMSTKKKGVTIHKTSKKSVYEQD